MAVKRKSATHRARMDERRERRLSLAAGFTPVRNGRIEKTLATHKALIAIQQSDLLPAARLGITEIEEMAWERVRKMLPAAPMRPRLFFKPSKSDSAAYRKIDGERRFLPL